MYCQLIFEKQQNTFRAGWSNYCGTEYAKKILCPVLRSLHLEIEPLLRRCRASGLGAPGSKCSWLTLVQNKD